MYVEEIMTNKVVSIDENETASVAARLLSRYNIGALPVCNAEGKLRGLLTDRDIVLRCVALEENPATTKVSKIMSRRIISVQKNDTIQKAANLMAKEQIRRLPVEQSGKIIGMVSTADLAALSNFQAEISEALSEISLNVSRK